MRRRLVSPGTSSLSYCTRKTFSHGGISIPVAIVWSLIDLSIPAQASRYRLLNKCRSASSHYPPVQRLALKRFRPSVRSSGGLLQTEPKLTNGSPPHLFRRRTLAQSRKGAKRCRVSKGFLCAFAPLREKN